MSPNNAIASAVQDLTLDPDGATTVITFARNVPVIALGDLVADDGQHATNVSIAGNVATVVWDARVSPASQVRVTGHSMIDNHFVSVTTSDSSAPTFTVGSALQVAGLGNDTIQLAFSGPRLVESEAEDPSNWTLTVGGQTMDLTGSTFDLDPNTQVVSITTGSLANLHASFTIAAAALHSVADVSVATTPHVAGATGDTTAPTLVSVEQNLAEDEYGRVIDITFSEAMDPVFCNQLANFVGNSPDLAVGFEQPAEDVLRITFNNPMVPGIDQFDLANLIDAAGNSFVDQTVAIAAGSTVANDFALDPTLVTVANQGHDYVYAEFEQALDPDDATDFSHWSLIIDPSGVATVIDLSTASLRYDLVAKSLTINLPSDQVTGADFEFAANPASYPHDVDGQDFQGSFDGQITGDATGPAIASSVQNRNLDPTGKTIDVTFSEDVEETLAETLGNWGVSGLNVVSATRLINHKRVRVVVDGPALPGDATLDVANLEDLAGNVMTPVVAGALTSTDTTAPVAIDATATAIEGGDNDELLVHFNDAMYAADVEDPANWTVESPVGSPLDVSAATIVYRNAGHQATMTFAAGTGIDLQNAASFSVALSTMRDIGANALTAVTLSGVVAGEQNLPTVASVWVEGAANNHLHVRFSEPCEFQDDIFGLSPYVVRDNTSLIKGYPVTAISDADALGVWLEFAFAIVAGSDTLDVAGVADLAGNPMFPANALAISDEDPSEVALDVGVSTATTVAGELNDVVVIVFDRRPSPWELLDPSHYDVSTGGNPVDLSLASFAWDGDLTVTITLDRPDAESLLTGTSYDVTVSGIQSAQGVDMSSPSIDAATASGDSTAPTLPLGNAKLDAAHPTTAVLIEMSEALDPNDATNVALIDLNGATNPDTAELVGPRTIRATFSGGVIAGDTLNITCADLAGNPGAASRAVTSADSSGPLVVSVSGTAVSGAGGDIVSVLYNKQVELGSALSATNYTITNGAVLSTNGASLTWNSSTRVVTIVLAEGQNLKPGVSLNVQVSDVYDHAGLAMSPPANIFGSVGGDAVGPNFSGAFANYRTDPLGATIDVLFSEDVAAAFAGANANWTASGGQTVDGVTPMTGSWYRVSLSSALAPSDTLALNGLPDCAGNTSGAISIAPQL